MYSDEPLAQWIKSHVKERGWQHKDLERRLEKASGGRLGASGAKRLVHGATKGTRPNQENLDLLAKVMGERPPTNASALAQMHARLEEVREELDRAIVGVETLTKTVSAHEERLRHLEAQPRADGAAAKGPRKRRSAG
jgi:hypothetical protein